MPSAGKPLKRARKAKSRAQPRERAATTARGGSSSANAGAIRAIDRAMAVLECLSSHPTGLTLSEISREVDLHKATTLRFLKALSHSGVVAPASGKAWKLGPAFFEIGARAADQTDIRNVARPIMEEASRSCRETVQLAIMADDSVVYVEKAEPTDLPLKINSQVGSRRPIHCTGLGKVLAAYQDWDEIKRIVKKVGMERFTPQTITNLTDLRAELSSIRSRGYAVDDREYNRLVVCAAAPVRDVSDRVVAGLSISTFGEPVEGKRFRDLIGLSIETADRISAGLGRRDASTKGSGA
jgi:DNA-binding IclR family transcriptional regulator